MGGIAQLARQFISPGVIGTDELRNDRLSGIEQACTAVAADIVHDADLAIVVAQEDEAGLADIDDRCIARFRHIAF
ncbi:hypothetical protein D9M68_452840 [compost metagenome]